MKNDVVIEQSNEKGRLKKIDSGKYNRRKKDVDKITYRLNNLWNFMNRQKGFENKFSSYEDFVIWSLNNGYKPWKTLKVTDESSEYRKDNCVWTYNNKVKKCANLKEDSSQLNVLRNLKLALSKVNDSMILLMEAFQILNDVEKYGGYTITVKPLRKIIRLIGKVVDSVDGVLCESNDIELLGSENSRIMDRLQNNEEYEEW